MKIKALVLAIGCAISNMAFSQTFTFSGEFDTELQWDMNKNTNWVNLLRLDAGVHPWKNGSFEVATWHTVETKETIVGDWQGFSNIEADNITAALAVLGYHHEWEGIANIFLGVRNLNEDFFISDGTALFTNSSPGIFPTIAASYNIGNYPVSALTFYFDVTWKNFTLKNSFSNGVAYNGWNRHNNPFKFNPSRDGIFNATELSYNYDWGSYFAGVAIHNRLFDEDEDGDVKIIRSEGTGKPISKVSCAWWLYGEQDVWHGDDDNKVTIMAQYSENSKKESLCRRYAEIGGIWTYKSNQLGLSGQYVDYSKGKEYSCEVTWNREINDHFAFQPAFQYIKNDDGHYTTLTARVVYNFSVESKK